MTIYYWWLAKQ